MDKIKAERSEIRQMLDTGETFEVDGKSFTIKQPTHGVLTLLSSVFIDLQYDEEKLQENPVYEYKLIANKNARLLAKAVAIAVLGRKCRIGCRIGDRDFGVINHLAIKRWTDYFFWKLTPSKTLEIILIITKMNNYGDFIYSLRLSSGSRVTAPNLKEPNAQA